MKPTDPREFYHWAREEMLPFVPDGTRTLLDVGCGAGGFGATVKERTGAEVWGNELSSEQAKQAELVLDRVLVGDVFATLNELPLGYFDVIAFNDLLEHLYDPAALLERVKPHLSSNGVVIASLPNIRYYKALKKILFDKEWRYEDNGIFDRTHVRFFTLKSMKRMWTDCGYTIEKCEGINGTKAIAFGLINLILLGSTSDTRYQQFGFRVRPLAGPRSV